MAVGTLASEDLPQIATEALVRGLDSSALRVLAGQARWDVRDSSDLFRVALDELGIELPDADRARWHLARCTAGDIVAGRIRAARGANELWLAYENLRDNGDLRIFVGLASTLEDHPEDTEQIEADIVTAARELLDRPAPRRWLKLMAVRGRSPLTQTAAACDNAAGVAAVLEAAAILRRVLPDDAGLAVALLDGEEAGATGSARHAPTVEPGTLVINLDGAVHVRTRGV